MKCCPKPVADFESNSKSVKSYEWFCTIKNMKKYTPSQAYKVFKGIIEINPSPCLTDNAVIEVCGKTKISCLQIQEQALKDIHIQPNILSQFAKLER